jgi:hypothetical protein
MRGLEMAKKKHAKKAAPAKKEKKSNLGWIIAAIVIIAIVALLVMKQGGQIFGEKKAETKTTSTPEKGALTATSAPTMEKKCLNPIGVVPGTRSGTLTVDFKNNGKTAIEGAYFEFTNAAGEKVYKMNSDSVQPGTVTKYTIDLNQVSSEIGTEVKDFVLYPIENGKACMNQRAFVPVPA